MKSNKEVKEKITKFVLYSLPCCKICQCENGKRMHCACHKAQLYSFISQTRQEVIEEIKKELERRTHYYRSIFSPDNSSGETEEEKRTEMLRKTDVLKLLEDLNKK